MAITFSPCLRVSVAATGAVLGLLLVMGGALGVGAETRPAVEAGAKDDGKVVARGKAKALKVEHVDVAQAASLLSVKTNVVVLDVRTPREFRGGHIAGATNINFNADSFADTVAKLDRDKTYLVHCAAGGRSQKSLEVFRKLGFQSIVHLDGGFGAWEAAGKPVVR